MTSHRTAHEDLPPPKSTILAHAIGLETKDHKLVCLSRVAMPTTLSNPEEQSRLVGRVGHLEPAENDVLRLQGKATNAGVGCSAFARHATN